MIFTLTDGFILFNVFVVFSSVSSPASGKFFIGTVQQTYELHVLQIIKIDKIIIK